MASPPRSQYYDVVGYSNPSGVFAPVTTTRVTVYVAKPYAATALTTVASIFSAETGAGTPGNPFNATTGEVSFWAAPGSYDIKIEDTGSPAKFAAKIIRADFIPGDAGILSQMLGGGAVSLANLASALQAFLLPTGAIIAYGGSDIPSGFLSADGSNKSSATYAALDAVIGAAASPPHKYNGGTSPGAGLFKMPDFLGRSPLGAGTGSGLTARVIGAKLGEEGHQLSSGESGMPAHNPTIAAAGGHNHGGFSGGTASGGDGSPISLNHTHSVAGNRNSAGGFSPTNLADPPSAGAFTTEGVNSAAAGADLQHIHAISMVGDHVHTASVSGVGAGSAHNTIHPVTVVPFLVKT